MRRPFGPANGRLETLRGGFAAPEPPPWPTDGPGTPATVDRGITTALNYVLVMGVVAILVIALVAGIGGLVGNQQDRALRSQLEVVGNRLADDLGEVDTLSRVAADGYSVEVRSDLPSRVVGARYTVSVIHLTADRYRLSLASVDPDVTVTVPFRSTTPVAEGTVHGGPLVLSYDSTADEVVVRRG